MNEQFCTELDKELQQIASIDWPGFVQIVGENAITAGKICWLRKKGKSKKQIENKLRLTRGKVQTKCKHCSTSIIAPIANHSVQ